MRKARVVSLNGIGNVHITLDNREAADSVLRLALAGERALGSALGQAINCANIGSLFEADGRIDSARHYYRLSMQLNEEAQSELGISLCHTHFGRLDEKEGRLDSAAAEYRRAYDIMERGSDTWHWLEACLALARVYTEKGDMAVAHTYLEKAKRTAADVSSLEYLAEAYRLEYLWHRKRGDSRAALASYERSRLYADSIFNDKNVRHMQNVRLRYERDNKQNEIDLKANFDEDDSIIPQPVSASEDADETMSYDTVDDDMKNAGMSFREGGYDDDDYDDTDGYGSSDDDADDLFGDDYLGSDDMGDGDSDLL